MNSLLLLVRRDDGYWLNIASPTGQHASIAIPDSNIGIIPQVLQDSALDERSNKGAY
jgi:hypothetical protein